MTEGYNPIYLLGVIAQEAVVLAGLAVVAEEFNPLEVAQKFQCASQLQSALPPLKPLW